MHASIPARAIWTERDGSQSINGIAARDQNLLARLFVFLLPLWVFGIIFPPTLDLEDVATIQFFAFVWLPILGLCVGAGSYFVDGLRRQASQTLLWTSAASFLAVLASALLSEDPPTSLAFVASVAIGLAVFPAFWRVIGGRMNRCLALFSIVGTALSAFTFYVDVRVQGRLAMGTAHPNYLGIVSFGLLMSALAVKPWPLTLTLIAANFYVIVQTESRSALGAALLGLVIFGCVKGKSIRRRSTAIWVIASLFFGAVLLMMYSDVASDYVSELFFLDDRYRGLGTGFTGRLGAWEEAIDLFRENPVFGVGFRMHERYMTAASSAHNGYLSLLAETGTVGTICLVIMTSILLWRLFTEAWRGSPTAIIGFSFVIGYLFIAAFERLFVNMGNPTSILAWLFLMRPRGTDGPTAIRRA